MNLTISDSDFLEYYTKAADMIYNNGEKEIIFIKNKDSDFHYVSPAYIEGLNPEGTVPKEVALGVEQTPNDESFKKSEEEDQEILKTRIPQSFLYVDLYDRIALIRKRPIVNPATNNCVGIIGSVRAFMLPNILDLIYKMNGVSYGIANTIQSKPLKYNLTERQHMVLFFYVNKYSYTEISSIMGILDQKISAGRVNDHLENLKYIFDVKSKEQLIEKAISLKYHLFIPRKFLRVGSYALDDAMIISEI